RDPARSHARGRRRSRGCAARRSDGVSRHRRLPERAPLPEARRCARREHRSDLRPAGGTSTARWQCVVRLPGDETHPVLAGRHAVVGEKSGFLTRAERVAVIGGEVTTLRVALVSLEDAVRLDYPIARWGPWAIAGAGTAV